MPLSFDPGEAYQFDWSHEYARLSGVTTKVKAAHMRLCNQKATIKSLRAERGELRKEVTGACGRGRSTLRGVALGGGGFPCPGGFPEVAA